MAGGVSAIAGAAATSAAVPVVGWVVGGALFAGCVLLGRLPLGDPLNGMPLGLITRGGWNDRTAEADYVRFWPISPFADSLSIGQAAS